MAETPWADTKSTWDSALSKAAWFVPEPRGPSRAGNTHEGRRARLPKRTILFFASQGHMDTTGDHTALRMPPSTPEKWARRTACNRFQTCVPSIGWSRAVAVVPGLLFMSLTCCFSPPGSHFTPPTSLAMPPIE